MHGGRVNQVAFDLSKKHVVIIHPIPGEGDPFKFCLHTLLQVTRYTTREIQPTLRRKMHMYKNYKRQDEESIHVEFLS